MSARILPLPFSFSRSCPLLGVTCPAPPRPLGISGAPLTQSLLPEPQGGRRVGHTCEPHPSLLREGLGGGDFRPRTSQFPLLGP